MTGPRVVVYTPRYFPAYVGGGERLAQLTAEGLRSHDVEVSILTHGPAPGRYDFDDVAILVIPHGPDAGSNAAELFAGLGPFVFHAIGSWADPNVVAAARNAGAIVGAAGTDYGQFCDNHRLMRAHDTPCHGRRSAADCLDCFLSQHGRRDRMLAAAGRWLPSPALQMVKSTAQLVRGRPLGNQLEWTREFCARDARRVAAAHALDVFIAPTRFALDRTAPHLGAKTHCEYVMHPLTNDLHRPEPKHTNPDSLVVGFAGRCLEMKGLHVLIDAIDRVRAAVPVKLVVETATNEGEERGYWEPLKARTQSMNNVEWRERGLLSSADLRRLHAGIDLLAVPSLWPEYVGFVTLEALSLGTPVILSDFPSQRELVADAESGAFISPGDSMRLAELLEQQWMRKRAGRRARTTSPALTTTDYASRLLAIYEAAA